MERTSRIPVGAHTTILVVAGDEVLRETLFVNLENEGYRVIKTPRGLEALSLAERRPSLIILDILLPDVNGLDLCRALRQKNQDAPIIILTGRSDDTDLVVGLEVGADDCIRKPVSIRELIARVRARLRGRTQPACNLSTFGFDDVEIDFETHRATRGGQIIKLTPREYDLLRLLIGSRGVVVSRHQLLTSVWGYSSYVTTRTIDNYILRLRKKLEEDPGHPKHILSVYGEGYKFVARENAANRDLVGGGTQSPRSLFAMTGAPT